MRISLHLALPLLFALLASIGQAQRVMPIGSGIPIGVGSQPDGVHAMLEYQGKLVIGGYYPSFNGHVRNNIQGWDGAQFYDMPGAFTGSTDEVHAMELFNGGLIAAGSDADINNIAQWDGSGWSTLGSGFTNVVHALAIYNGQLVAAEAGHVHVWNGTNWTELGTGFLGAVNVLAVYNGDLYAGGTIAAVAGGGAAMHRLAKWNGTSWEQVLTGLNGTVTGILGTDAGLVVTGSFTSDGNSTLALPFWTTYDGSQFLEEPALNGGLFNAVCAYPGGGFILGGGASISLPPAGSPFRDPAFKAHMKVLQPQGPLLPEVLF